MARAAEAEAAPATETDVDGAEEEPLKTGVLLRMSGGPGALARILQEFKGAQVNITRVETRPSKWDEEAYDVYIDFDGCTRDPRVERLVASLRRTCQSVVLLGPLETPWFPRRLADLDAYANRILSYGGELDADHPGFRDPVYRERRAQVVAAAAAFRHGDPLPRVAYTAEEDATWRAVYSAVMALVPTHACRPYHHLLPLLEHSCGYGPERVPQLADVSAFLSDATGFRLRPVSGLLAPRDFLNALAFRVFHSTQYIRHHSAPLYTPEPDVLHELLGHVPLLADPEFAAFSQEIGLASLGASDEDIVRLSTLYWFTVEFGLVLERARGGGAPQVRAYGAGLLSSPGELQYALSGRPALLELDVAAAARRAYPITEYQPAYFVAPSFPEMTAALRRYADESLRRPFNVRYHAHSKTIEVDRNIIRAQ